MSAADEVRAEIARRIHDEIVPKLELNRYAGGYDCCGCSTYGAIVDDILALVAAPDLERSS